MNRIARIALAIVTLASGVTARADTAPAPGPALDDLIVRYWDYRMSEAPDEATSNGDYRYNDKWPDMSLAHVPVHRKASQDLLDRFNAVGTAGLTEEQRLNRELVIHNLTDEIATIDLKLYEMPLDQIHGEQLWLPLLAVIAPFDSTRHVEEYVTRLHGIPHLLGAVTEVARQGLKDGLIPPKFLLEKVAKQCHSIADAAGEKSPFARPVLKFGDGIPAADRARLHDAVIAAVDSDVRPAYAKLAAFVETDYAPHGRADIGVSSVPNGTAIYKFLVRKMTTTDLDPEAIHQLGLSEVARIEGEMTVIAHKLGYADLKTLKAALKADPKQHLGTRAEILDRFRQYIAGMKPRLPTLFGRLPRAEVEVAPIEEFREKGAPPAQYFSGTPDGKRPGRVMVNTGDPASRPVFMMEAIAYHEGVPGHHLDRSIAQELPGLPPFRQHGSYVAFTEGWGLYAEHLGKDVGLYQDPTSDYGRLAGELFRAARLVVDTGAHAKHWTREQMVAYFHEHSDLDETSVQAEIDRYIAMPGQALAYKIGQLKFLELRDRAKKKLGGKFDIRAFHDQMLGGGALPLDVLDARTNEWIARVAGNAR